MADEPKPIQPGASGKADEAAAADLLSLWGGGAPPKPAAPAVPRPAPAASKPAPAAPREVPVASKPAPAAPKPTLVEPKSVPVAPKPPPIAPFRPQQAVSPPPAAPPPKPHTPPKIHHIEPKPPSVEPKPFFEQKPEPKIEPKPEPKPEPKAASKPLSADDVLEGEIVDEKHPPAAPSARAASAPAPREPAEPAAAPESEIEFSAEEEGFGAQLDDFLKELNLSRRHIFYGIGCVVLIIALIFGGIYGYRFYKNRKKTSEAPPAKPPAEITIEDTGIPSSADVGKTAALTDRSIGDAGISAAVSIGTEFETATTLATHILLFRRIENAYSVNLDELLSKSTDRRSSLEGHLALLNKLHEDGVQASGQIEQELSVIKLQYEPQRVKQEETDANFFEQLTALNAQTAQDILNDFIDASEQVVVLRARFKALQKVQSFYAAALPKLALRIHDIELNKEALIAGIKVYKVQGSDLKMVVPVETGLPAKKEKGESLSAAGDLGGGGAAFPLAIPGFSAGAKSGEKIDIPGL